MNYRKSLDPNKRASARNLLPLVAIGGGLAAAPAGALELGELTMQSYLGQPLRASIAYALAPNEMLSDACVSVSAVRSTGGLPGIGSSTVTITDRAIVITGNSAVREPMLGTRVTINCPYTPNLSREYMLLVDPAPVAATASPLPGVASAPVAPATARDAQAPSRPAPRAAVPIGQSTRYRVMPGDSLSGIVSRIENRSLPLWPAVEVVFAANPGAFIDNDPNKLKAGSWLTIPSLDGSAPVVTPPVTEPAPGAAVTRADDAVAGAEDSSTTTAASTGQADAYEPAVSAYEPAVSGATPGQDAATTSDSTADLKPGDVIPGDRLPETDATLAIPDTELEGPQTTSSSPNVPTAIVSTGSRSESTSLLMWLLGGGLAIAAAALLFGRRARDRFGSAPAGAVAVGGVAAQQDVAADDYDIDDDSPTEENLVLDADLEIGTGLDQGVEVDTAQDFGFAATSDLDIELPFEPEAPAADSDTDIIPPVTSTLETILDSEVLPDDDDYDMSVIVDATKMPQADEVTERDLQAVALDNDDADDSFTINEEVAYNILEQDYEDELSATQALNQEIERAAAELAADLDEAVDEEETSLLPGARAGEPEATAELPTAASETTVEFEASYDPNDTNAVTVNMSSEEKTAEMPVANDDETVEMDVEGGKVDTRKG